MPLTFRLGTPGDADRCGTICYEAFTAIAAYHHFPGDFPSPEVAAASFSVIKRSRASFTSRS
jgi:hypothetical protein